MASIEVTGGRLLRVEEAAQYVSVAPKTITAWIRDGALPAHRIPGTRRWLIDPAELERTLRGERAS